LCGGLSGTAVEKAVTATPELPPKKDVMTALLERSSVFIHLDPRHEEVRVPAWFKKQPQLVLQVGLNMAVSIPDLDVADDAVTCTLSFNRSPFFCYIPWAAIFALVAEDGKGMLWPNDIPKEVAAQQAERAQKEAQRERMRAVGPEPQKPGAAAEAKILPAKATSKKKGTGQATPRAEKRPVAAEKPRPARPANAKEAAPPARDGKKPLPSYLRVVK
jgi:stringent starvation protein B